MIFRVKTIPLNSSPHQINWGKGNTLKNHQVDILLSNSQNVKNQAEEEKVLNGHPKERASRIRSSMKSVDQTLKAENDDKSQEVGFSMFQASMVKSSGVKEEVDENLNSHDLNNDSIFGSNINNVQNLGRKDSRQPKVMVKDSQHDLKAEPSELSFNMVDHDDRSELNLLGL